VTQQPLKISKSWGDLLPRTVSAVVLVPVVLALLWQGGVWFSLLAGFLGVMIAREYVAIVHRANDQQFALHVIAVLAPVVLLPAVGAGVAGAAIVICVVLSNVLAQISSDAPTFWQRIGVAYVAFPVFAMMLVRGSASGFAATTFLLLMVWAADTLAYFFGRTIGGPKIAPRLSPKKTWAGLLGAACGAVLVSALVVAEGWATGFVPLAVFSILLAVVEQIGDFFESACKRVHNVKDSGDLIPGHGGMLDRVDGLMAVFAFAAIVGLLRNLADPAAGITLW
jgi:phosphatidate cytidylyltransferase